MDEMVAVVRRQVDRIRAVQAAIARRTVRRPIRMRPVRYLAVSNLRHVQEICNRLCQRPVKENETARLPHHRQHPVEEAVLVAVAIQLSIPKIIDRLQYVYEIYRPVPRTHPLRMVSSTSTKSTAK